MKAFVAFIAIGVVFLLAGCVDPLELDLEQDVTRLVVNGSITTDPGPYTVTLTQTRPLPYVPDKIPVVSRAVVVISDDAGNEEVLLEEVPGTYKTDPNGIKGMVGRTYTLTIKTPEGKLYRSKPETIKPVSPLEKVYFEVEKRLILDKDNQVVPVHYLNVLVDTKDPAATKDYYQWKYQGVYQVETQPWDHTKPAPRTGMPLPDPLPCCKTCWVTIFNNVISLQDDRLINGKDLKKQLVVKIPIDNQIFDSRLHVEVLQHSLSAEAYDYLNALKTQVGSVGNIQDPPPAYIQGNMVNEQDPDDTPLGFFSASAISRNAMFVNDEELGIPLLYFVLPDDCRVIPNSTTLRPVFW